MPLGRRNHLFVHDVERGASLAGLYSLVATCEARGINLFEYLADVLARVPDHPASAIDELLRGARIAARDRELLAHEAYVTTAVARKVALEADCPSTVPALVLQLRGSKIPRPNGPRPSAGACKKVPGVGMAGASASSR